MESGFAGPRRAWEGSHLPSGWRPCHRLLGELQERSAKRRFRHAPWSVIGDGSGSQWELARASAMRCSRRTISQGPFPDNATCARPHTGRRPLATVHIFAHLPRMAILGATNPLGNQTLVRNVVEGYPDVRLPLMSA